MVSDIVRAGAPQKRIMITAGVTARSKRAIQPTCDVMPAATPRAPINSIHNPVSIACMYSVRMFPVYRDPQHPAVSYCTAFG